MNLLLQNLQLYSKRIEVVLPLTRYQKYTTKIFLYQRPQTISRHPKYVHYSSSQQLRATNSLRKKQFGALTFEHVSDETLESLTEKLEELIEERAPAESDITLATGVLTFSLGQHGTYVINKQSPNKQIWLSSPFSGPKRYDFQNNNWVYKHDGTTLHDLLSKELSKVFHTNVDLKDCDYGGKNL